VYTLSARILYGKAGNPLNMGYFLFCEPESA